MSDIWSKMARRFHTAANRWPEVRHVLVENTEAVPIEAGQLARVACEVDVIFGGFDNDLVKAARESGIGDDVEELNRLRSAMIRERLDTLPPADRAVWDRCRKQKAPFCGHEVACLRSKLAPIVRSVHDYWRGVEHYFHGSRAGGADPSWHDFADLAHLAVKLAIDTGQLEPLPPHDPARFESEALQDAVAWMELVYRLARAPQPGSLLTAKDRGNECVPRLPDGLTATRLTDGVFTASALACEALAEATPATPRVSGGSAGTSARIPAVPPPPVPNIDEWKVWLGADTEKVAMELGSR